MIHPVNQWVDDENNNDGDEDNDEDGEEDDNVHGDVHGQKGDFQFFSSFWLEPQWSNLPGISSGRGVGKEAIGWICYSNNVLKIKMTS